MPKKTIAPLVIIGGLDPLSHSGILADTAFAKRLGHNTACAISCTVPQNNNKVFAIHSTPKGQLYEQIKSILQSPGSQGGLPQGQKASAPPSTPAIQLASGPAIQLASGPVSMRPIIKIGLLATKYSVEEVAQAMHEHSLQGRIILDTPFISSSGCKLSEPNAIEAIVRLILPMAMVVTSNAQEFSLISGLRAASMAPILFKSSYINKSSAQDTLFTNRGTQSTALCTQSTEHNYNLVRGTGCRLATGIACFAAKGLPLSKAILGAKNALSEWVKEHYPEA